MTATHQDKSKIVERIKGLLKLSASPNENEALQAASKAQELLLLYNLSISDIDNDLSSVTEKEVEIFRNIPTWKRALIFGIASTNFCVPIVTPKKINGSTCRRVAFVGRPENTIIAEILYIYLKNEIERVTDLTNETSRTYRTNFRLGCAGRIVRRLNEILKKQKEEGIKSETNHSDNVSALVVSSLHEKNSLEIQVYLDNKEVKKGKKVSPKSLNSKTAAQAYYDGIEAGNKISLNKQLEG